MICLGKFWILFISFTNLGALCLYFYDTSPSGHILYYWLSYHLFTNVKITIPSKNEVFMVVVFCCLNSFSWALWGLSTFWWQLQSAGFSSRNSLTWLTKTFQIKLSRLTTPWGSFFWFSASWEPWHQLSCSSMIFVVVTVVVIVFFFLLFFLFFLGGGSAVDYCLEGL